jgi:inhibitor of KinA sporulation pathway (predicted exonuclease)
VSATVATIIKDLVSCVDRVVRATTAVDDAKDSSSKIITLTMILNQHRPTTRSAWESDSTK